MLRDKEFDSLEDLCAYFDKEVEDIKAYLLQYGYAYNEEQKQMRAQ